MYVFIVQETMDNGQDNSSILVLCDLYEKLVPGSLNIPKKFRRSRTFFAAPDNKWNKLILKVNKEGEKDEKRQQHQHNEENQQILNLMVNPYVNKRRGGRGDGNLAERKHKKARTEAIPSVSNHMIERNGVQVSVQHVREIKDLVQPLLNNTLVLPERSLSILKDSAFQHAFCLQPESKQICKLRTNLSRLLEDEFFSAAKAPINKDVSRNFTT